MDLKIGKYKGVSIDRVLSIPLYRRPINNLYKAIFHHENIVDKSADTDILFIYSHERSKRNDFNEILDNFVSYLSALRVDVVSMKSTFSFFCLYKLIKKTKTAYKLISVESKRPLYRLYLVVVVAKVLCHIDNVYSYLSSSDFKVLVTFSDAHDIDSILTQCAKKLRKKTVTLQHGQYSLSKRDVAENQLIKNFTSDYICSWGGATAEVFNEIKVDKKRIPPLGSLRSYAKKVSYYRSDRLREKTVKKVICLMLNADNSESKNLVMIGIINHYCVISGYSYCLRFHPESNRSKYIRFSGSNYIGEYGDYLDTEVSFSVIYTSGVMIEMLVEGEPFFLYVDEDTPSVYKIEGMTFSDSSMLSVLVGKMSTNNEEYCELYNKTRDHFVNTCQVEKSYNDFFIRLLG